MDPQIALRDLQIALRDRQIAQIRRLRLTYVFQFPNTVAIYINVATPHLFSEILIPNYMFLFSDYLLHYNRIQVLHKFNTQLRITKSLVFGIYFICE